MKSNLLYPLLLLGVLTGSACSSQDRVNGEESVANAAGNEDASEMAEATAADHSDADILAPGTIEPDAAPYRIIFLGDSITDGLGVDEERAFPALIRQRVVENGYPFQIIEAGISGDTSAGGLSRIDWVLQDGVDILVLELGGNDGLRGVNLASTRNNLQRIIEKTLEAYPNSRIIVAGMMVPPNLGHEYTESFRQMYPELADRFDAVLIPFILEGVGGVSEMMQPDGIHPNADGHAKVAKTVWGYLEPVIQTTIEDGSAS